MINFYGIRMEKLDAAPCKEQQSTHFKHKTVSQEFNGEWARYGHTREVLNFLSRQHFNNSYCRKMAEIMQIRQQTLINRSIINQ